MGRHVFVLLAWIFFGATVPCLLGLAIVGRDESLIGLSIVGAVTGALIWFGLEVRGRINGPFD